MFDNIQTHRVNYGYGQLHNITIHHQSKQSIATLMDHFYNC